MNAPIAYDITLMKHYLLVSCILLLVTADPGMSQERKIVTEDSITTLGKYSETIPLGYGLTRTREALTGAVSRIGAADLAESMVINPGNALYGRLPGLTVLENSGLPPSSPSLYVRGRGTFTDSSPLILVDGFERPLSTISPGEIEQVVVLKDAAALAKYGQQGANGVVLVTTKRGSREGLQVSVSYDLSFTRPTTLPGLVDAPIYARALNEARANDGRAPRYSAADLQAFDEGTSPYLFPNVDWFDEVLRDHGVRHNLSTRFRGGSERARYFATLSYADDSSLFGPVGRNDGYSSQLRYQRFNFRTNLDIDLTDRLLFQADVAGNLVEHNRPGGGDYPIQIFNAMYRIPSAAFPVKVPDGRWGGTRIYADNPMALLTDTGYGRPNAREFSLTGRLRQDLDFWIDGLSAEAAVRYHNFGEFHERERRSYSYASIAPVHDENGTIVDTTVTGFGQDSDLTFNDSFGNKRQFSDVVGKVSYQTKSDNHTLEAMALFHQSERMYDGQNETYRRRNIMGHVYLGLVGRYFVDLTASYSGSNLMPAGDRYGIFPAVSAGWLLSEEGFLQEAGFLNRLKLRVSWGMSGSDRLPTDNPYEPAYHRGGGGYWFRDANQHQPSFFEGRLGSSDFTYETAYQTNIGIEAKLLGRLELSADLFYARRTDIWTGTSGRISEVLGLSPPPASEGIVENRGLEATLGWEGSIGEVAFRLGGGISFARNKIEEMNESHRPYEYLTRTGRSVGQWFGLEAIGFFEGEEDIASSPRQVFSEVRPGDIKYRDQNGDGIINEFDEVPLGCASGYPEIYFSADFGLQYKGLTVSALLQGTGNYTAYLNTTSVFRPLGNSNNTVSQYYYERRWTPETAETATFPRLTTESSTNNFQPNDLWLVDGSYLKLRTVEVSYALPASLVEPWKISGIEFYLQGRNLFSIDDVPELDPEHLGTGYPLLRSYSLGLEIQF